MPISKKLSDVFKNMGDSVASDGFIKVLTERGAKIVEDAKKNASFNARIPDAIELKTVRREGVKFIIPIKIDLKKAPEAGAYEFGSGEHATRQPPQRYEIHPRNAPDLVFSWPDPKNPVTTPKGKIRRKIGDVYFFGWVEHPGVEPRPYLFPAIDSNRSLFVESVISEVKVIFRKSIDAAQ